MFGLRALHHSQPLPKERHDVNPILSVLITVATSGLVSALVVFRLNSRHEARQFRTQKLELLYQAFNGFVSQLGRHWLPLMSVMSGSIDYNAALDIINRRSADEPRHFENFEMLIALYFPELQEYRERLISIRERANDVIHDHKRAYKEIGPHPSHAIALMQGLSADLTRLEGDFRNAARLEATKLNKKLGRSA